MIILILGKGTSNQCHLVVNNLVLFSILDQDFCVVALLLLLPLLLNKVTQHYTQVWISWHRKCKTKILWWLLWSPNCCWSPWFFLRDVVWKWSNDQINGPSCRKSPSKGRENEVKNMPFRFRNIFADFVPDSYLYVIYIVFFQFDDFLVIFIILTILG